MIAESLRSTIQLIETINKISPLEDKKLRNELLYLVKQMRFIELKLINKKDSKEYLASFGRNNLDARDVTDEFRG